jgi:Domain of unknown function (DUF4157)
VERRRREASALLPGGRVDPAVQSQIDRLRRKGASLDAGVRARIAPRVGDPLADVRVHDGPLADTLARSVQARAFTTGRDIFFARGEYRPGTAGGDKLLAHELRHVVQQRGAPVDGPMTVTSPGDRREREANRSAVPTQGPTPLQSEGPVLARMHSVATLPPGKHKLDAPSGPQIELTVVAADKADPKPDELTPDEFIKLENAWASFLGAGGDVLTQSGAGLQLRDAAIADLVYTGTPTGTRPKHPDKTGTAGTAAGQADLFVNRIAKELPRSRAARGLFVKLVSSTDPKQVVRIYLAQGSVGFYDSAATFGLDIAHENYLPEDPVEQPDKSLAGVTRGELLMHVLEERYYMVYNGWEYAKAHKECLKPDSLQNAYRRERGIASTSIDFGCQAYNDKTVDKQLADDLKGFAGDLQDFMAADSSGVVTRVAGLDEKLMHIKEMPAPSERGTSVGSNAEYMRAKKLEGWAICVDCARRAALALGGKGLPLNANFEMNTGSDQAPTFASTVEFAVAEGAANGISRQAALKALNDDWRKARTEAGKWAKDEIAKNKLQIQGDTAKAKQHIAALAAVDDPGDVFLLAARQRRAAAVNDAPTHSVTGKSTATHEDTNCGAVTMAVIYGTTSTGLMDKHRKLSGKKGKGMFPGAQDDASWWEEVNDPDRNFGGAAPPSFTTGQEFESAKGDAQWYGMRDLLLELAKRRETAHGFDVKWAVEQFREPEIDKGSRPAAKVDEVMKAMAAYPNGTQFCLWLYAPPPDRMQHYVYAEKFRGRVVVEDYQPNKSIKTAPEPHSYVDQMPNKSLLSFAPNYFTHGAFWALKPTFSAKTRAEESTDDKEWRRLLRYVGPNRAAPVRSPANVK